MTYQELLSTQEWRSRRYYIIQKNCLKCQNCNNKTYFINSKGGKIINGLLTGQIGDFINEKTFIKNIYKIQFSESNLTYYRSGESKPIFETTFDSFEYYKPNDLEGLNVLYLEEINSIRLLCVAKSNENSIQWLYVNNLHVHHKYYQEGKKPWQYPDTALTTLCWACHEELHENSTVPWLDNNGNIKGRLTNCSRCHGAGYIRKFSHIENGVCFKCNGRRFKEFINNPQLQK